MDTLYGAGSTAVEIAEHLKGVIRAGELAPGALLPAVRTLAQQLGVNPNTVAAAYARLRDAGLVVADGRRGTRVAEPPSVFDSGTAVPAGLVDLARGNVDGALLPRPAADWLPLPTAMAGYDADSDAPELLEVARQWIAAQPLPAGSAAAPAVFSGTLDAVERALRAHAHPGGRIWVEDPCWPPVLALLAHLRLKPVPLPVDGEGCTLPGAQERAEVVILTPRAHNPTGVSMSAARAAAWSAFLADRPDCLLILDDYWGPLAQQAALPAFSVAGPWLYLVSVSKFLGPDLRVAVATGGPPLLSSMRRQQMLGPRWVSLLLQRLAAALWRQAGTDGSLARAGTEYIRRRRWLCRLLAERGTDAAGAEGLHLWLPVSDEAAAAQLLAARGWAVQPGQPFRLRSGPALRVSLGNVTDEQVERLAGDLAEAVRMRRRVSV